MIYGHGQSQHNLFRDDARTLPLDGLPACLLGAALPAQAAELVVMVDSTANMPMALVEDGRLVDGVHKEIGQILARHMGRQLRFLTMRPIWKAIWKS